MIGEGIGGVSGKEGEMNIVRSLWKGEIRLVITYWIYGVVGGVVFNVLFALFESTGVYESDEFGVLGVVGLLLLVSWIVYSVLVFVGIWRSANNYQGPGHWAALAKIMVVVGAVSVVVEFFGGI